MNPMVQQIVFSLVRFALASVSAALIQRGVLSPEQTDYVIVGIGGLILAVGWGVWVKYKDRIKFVTAQASGAGTTEREVEMLVQSGAAPPATLSKDVSPYLTKTSV